MIDSNIGHDQFVLIDNMKWEKKNSEKIKWIFIALNIFCLQKLKVVK